MAANCQTPALTRPQWFSANVGPLSIGYRKETRAVWGLRWVSSGLPQAPALTCANAATRRAGCHIPATAPNSDNTAEMPIAGTNPALKAWGDPKLPLPMKAATAIAIPDTPPRKRSMLNVPDALPMSVWETELKTAFWAAGIAMETPAPAMISGATMVA